MRSKAVNVVGDEENNIPPKKNTRIRVIRVVSFEKGTLVNSTYCHLMRSNAVKITEKEKKKKSFRRIQ